MGFKIYRDHSINRNIVECKGNKIVVKLDSCGQVLIETLWNVKWCVYISGSLFFDRVLIETLWNVKTVGQPCEKTGYACINRNIVECKAGTVTEQRCSVNRINRNIVECKDCCRRSSLVRTVVLIETLWNVKVDAKPLWYLGESRINRNIVECKDRHIHSLHRWSCGY